MELEFEAEGGFAEVSSGRDSRTMLNLFAEGEQVRMAIDSQSTHGEIGLEVGLDADQAREVGEYLLEQAELLVEDEDEE